MDVESGGKCDEVGSSGENGCMQFLPETWKAYSIEILGYVAPMTKTNEVYVASAKITQWLELGHDYGRIALNWNMGEGNNGICISGDRNSYGQPYDSCAYKAKVLARINA